MASATPLKELEHNFCHCSICLEQYKEPKLLPCLHRYCRDCLKTVIQGSMERKLNCPMCKQQCLIPENGVDGFKTDFHTKNILEFIQLQKLLENKDLKDCVSCLRKTNVSAYCFKCRDFLCNRCYNVHITSKMFIDHQPRTVELDDTLTLEKLSTLSEIPRCYTHVEEYAKLCCTSCGNKPVCIICSYSKHKDHDLRDVTEVAEFERDLLQKKLGELSTYERKLYELPKEIKTCKEQLQDNILRKKEQLLEQYRQQTDMTKSKLDDIKVAREDGVNDIEKRRNVKASEIDHKFECELRQLKQKYERLKEETKAQFESEILQFNDKYDKIEEDLVSKFKLLGYTLQTLTTATDELAEQNKQKLDEVSDLCDRITKRYENFTSTAFSMLASKEEWTDVRCIPDLNSACEGLIEEMKREFPKLDFLSVVDVSDITKVIYDNVTISEDKEFVLDFERNVIAGYFIDRIACIDHENTVITGSINGEHSYIIVTNKNGEIKRNLRIKKGKKDNNNVYRYCTHLSMLKIATVCTPDEIGIYDVRAASYKAKCISNVITSWSSDSSVWCVANDPVNNHIIVGANSKHVYVFDDQLDYSHTLTLPDVIGIPYEIAVHEGNLLVCGFHRKSAYAVKIEKSECKLVHEFTKPDQVKNKWRPRSVCTDQNKFIYMLWSTSIPDGPRCILLQYSQDGRQVLARKEVDADVGCMTTVAGKVLMATSKKIYTYGLKVT